MKRQNLTGLFVGVMLALWCARAGASTVQFIEVLDNNYNRYRVNGAEGKDQEAAKDIAVMDAIVFAAKELTGSDDEKRAIELARPVLEKFKDLARKGRVLNVVFVKGGVRIDVVIEVNVKELRRKLEEAGLIAKAQELAEQLGNPVVLILPEGSDGKKITSEQQIIIDRIASFFTQQKYDLADLSGMKNLQEMTKATEALSGVLPDPVAEIATLVGADIYVTFTAGISGQVMANASIKAYETTTAKLLASATGQSRRYPYGHPEMDAVLEAVSDAVPKVFEDISGYWHEQVSKGRFYTFVISGNLGDREKQKALREALKDIGTVKFNVKTQQKFAGTIRTTKDADAVEDAIEDAIKDAGYRNVQLVVSNRALFIFRVE